MRRNHTPPPTLQRKHVFVHGSARVPQHTKANTHTYTQIQSKEAKVESWVEALTRLFQASRLYIQRFFTFYALLLCIRMAGCTGALALETLRAVLLHTTGQIRGTVVVLCLGHVTVEPATGARMRGRARGLVQYARSGWLAPMQGGAQCMTSPPESCLCFGCRRVEPGEAENTISIFSFQSLFKRR